MEDSEIQKSGVNLKLSKSNKYCNFDTSANLDNKRVKFGLLNIRSIIAKSSDVYQLLMEGLDIFVIVESWHGSSDHISVKMSMPPGYIFVDFLRINDPCHGGLIIFFRDNYKFEKINLPVFVTFEALCVALTINRMKIIFLAVYRPGSDMVSSLFFEELSSMLEFITTLCHNVILLGDLNIHVERINSNHAIYLNDIFDLFHMRNVVNQSTHDLGGILDLIVSGYEMSITDVEVYPSGVYSDHSLVTACLPITRPLCPRVKKSVRSWNRVDKNKFISMIEESPISKLCDYNDPNEAAEFFHNELLRIANIVAPIHMVESKSVATAPWYDGECRELGRKCRRAERKYRMHYRRVEKEFWIDLLKQKNRCFREKKENYWKKLVNDNNKNPKRIWKILNKILCRESTANVNVPHSANDFAGFFVNKVEIIKNNISVVGEHSIKCRANVKIKFCNFLPVSPSEVKAVVIESPSTFCMIDCIPANIFKQYIDYFLLFFTGLLNLCLTTGTFPAAYRHAIVVPLLKQPSLDMNDLKNFRPVSNLTFVSKVVERIVLKQFLKYLNDNDFLPINQSGFRRYHSTETALLRVLSGLFEASDHNQVSLLALLDMSAAFDCVNHDILLSRLCLSYGVCDSALDFFKSYLCHRTQQVYFDGSLSDVVDVLSGVPQGSVLGPLLFTLYTADVLSLIDNYTLNGFAYADDVQIVTSGLTGEMDFLIKKLMDCLSALDEWLGLNSIKMNQGKTQLVPIGTWQQTSKIITNHVTISDNIIDFKQLATLLGCTIDRNLSMSNHIKALVKSCSFQLRQLNRIKKSLNKSTMTALIHSFIHSRLDYCNSLLYGISKHEITKLQTIQNRAARLVVCTGRFEHISPVLMELHWLPVNKRIIFKVCVMVYRCLNGLAPQYLSEMLIDKCSISQRAGLRSDGGNLLLVPVTKLRIASRSFAVCGPRLWNDLPQFLRQPGLTLLQFKKQLKTYLFSL